MQFRVRDASGNTASTMQLWLCVFWMAMSGLNLHHDLLQHHRYDTAFHMACLVIFTAALAFHLYFFFCGSITLDDDTFTLRQSFRPLTLPYSAVVDAQPAFTSNGRILTHVVELEIAKVSPDVYPHQYRKMYLKDPDAFLEAIRSHLPFRQLEAS